ncbi:MAG: hypothetical protein APF78_09315 [Sphingomonadales bacterium BRH_c3]|nr:MAG: hypothetical protein APF78_09315 [Sphingomonadales bacterium BRH_c3]
MNDPTVSATGGEERSVEDKSFAETVRFLRMMRPDGKCVLSAICPNGGGIETRTFELDPPDRLLNWLGRWNGKRNLYWTPNTVKADANPNKKPEEADIEWMDMLYVDADPRKGADWTEERQRIHKAFEDFDPPPSAVVDSGNGFQAFWQLVPEDRLYVGDGPEAVASAKLYNIALRDKLGGDNCQSLDHLMRLPGTRNLPNKKKRDAGRVEQTASVVKWPTP